MITPELEKLILTGNATYKTYAMGGSAVGCLPISNSAEYIVITDFIWTPFNDDDITQDDSPDRLTRWMIHTMKLYNSKLKSYYNFRDSFQTNNRLNQVGNTPSFTHPHQYTSFFVSKEDIHISIFKFAPVINGTVFNNDFLPLSSNEQPPPNGYAGERVTRSINTLSGANISNEGLKNDPGSLAPNGRNRNEFFDDVDVLAGTTLLPPDVWTNNGGMFSFPIVTFGYVEINKTPGNTARG